MNRKQIVRNWSYREVHDRVMESLTDEQLAGELTHTEPGWPRAKRDLTSLEKEN